MRRPYIEEMNQRRGKSNYPAGNFTSNSPPNF